jgi:hypothetical protein
MVLTGLIIIAVVLMALMAPGIQRKLPVPMPATGRDRAAPGYRGATS